jgi:hypothetical protein
MLKNLTSFTENITRIYCNTTDPYADTARDREEHRPESGICFYEKHAMDRIQDVGCRHKKQMWSKSE